MTVEEASKILKMSDQAIWLKGLEKEQKEAEEIAIRSLEAWEKVREEIKSLSNSFYFSMEFDLSKGLDMALESISKHLKEVENADSN